MNEKENNNSETSEKLAEDFIRTRIKAEMEEGRYNKVHTRFPPEPNGYLHIGHAKAICIDFGIAEEFKGKCNLRFDDTNPIKEETKFVESIQNDIKWLGYDWEDRLYYASDYFGKLYEWAIKLINDGNAYVDDLTADEIREHRGTLTEPGRESPYRNRSRDENLDLFEKMKKGNFPDGSKTLRAKIDMSAGNMNMRDPVMYRVLHAEHHRTGSDWCIYPTYDWAHGQSDSIEDVTYSLCDLDFEDHRPLYDWFLDKLGVHHPQQIEFARLNITYTILSKRKLIRLVEDKIVDGWDDPRMPTLSGLKRRGFTPSSVRTFIDKVGVAKKRGSIADIALLEHGLREELNKIANRTMAVLNPLKVIITNYPEDKTEEFEADNNPEDESAGTRTIPFSNEIYIERNDFMEDPPKKFFRLAPGREVRLKHTYFITCDEVIKDEATGEIKELHCTYDPASRGGSSPDGRKVKGTLHWVSAKHSLKSEVRIYDHLFTVENPSVEEDYKTVLNANSKTILNNCMIEPNLKDVTPGTMFQFLRNGYFCVDYDSVHDKIVFNRTVSLRDSWAKMNK
jgi:glutaminyl-tRNA synthetase